ncbi:conserved hypothetical protein [Theileria orientalis strain Shintoku]|uniref:GINS subunit domain-containing protein n=1 Tax=Theileria orientalis strain Shintoku TaxID=869250 RepID=J4CD44_THEOR|nr:conserved hypothetical protein [Theileria orientalis strain Shintoku]PVC51230.1 hypothetical protein MACL_00001695 [Theileria orientalis]BAM40497.1 conserved hypothetical protein [Theileria orientalis strain Shintoku]|eukprot:XP_009690798.1 conserved hypothetical protein [Theileria orientalis strain Shintoku]
MDFKHSNSSTYYSLEVLSEIFKNEDVSTNIQSYPEEVSRRVSDEIDLLLENFVKNTKKYESTRVFDGDNTSLMFKYKLLMDYYAIMYIYANKNIHLYKAYRWNIVQELATIYNGYYDFIPDNIIHNLSDLEISHLRERCLYIKSHLKFVNTGKYTLIGILKDIVTDDLSEPNSSKLKFYQKNTRLFVPSHMADLLRPCKWIKILKVDM